MNHDQNALPRKFEYIEHTADLGFKAYGTTPESLFINAAEALFEVLLSVETIRIKEKRIIKVQAASLDDLMVSWLSELLYLFDTEALLLRRFEITDMNEERLQATVRGEFMDPARHEIKTCIKAVTYHQLYVRKNNDIWESQVILDL
jgi:SHS2 domain-containing protein